MLSIWAIQILFVLVEGKSLSSTMQNHLMMKDPQNSCFWLTHYHTMPHFDALNPFPNKLWFLHVCSTSLLKTLKEKEKLLVTSNFSFSQCLLPFWKTFCHFQQIQYCCLQTLSVWKSLSFVVLERVKIYSCGKHCEKRRNCL